MRNENRRCSNIKSNIFYLSQVIDVYHKVLFSTHISVVTKQYALMSLTKLTTRFTNATPKIQEIIDAFGSHLQVRKQ